MCKNTDKYLHALTRILRFMDQGITKTAHRSFHISQFSCYQWIWMLYGRKLGSKINKTQEGATFKILRFVIY